MCACSSVGSPMLREPPGGFRFGVYLRLGFRYPVVLNLISPLWLAVSMLPVPLGMPAAK